MPNDVVDAVHRLVAATIQAGGITFTDKDSNIIMDNDDKEDENMTEDEPIPVTNYDNNQMEINEQEQISPDLEETGNEDDSQSITGVNMT